MSSAAAIAPRILTPPNLTVAIFQPRRVEPIPPGGVLRSSWRVGKRAVTLTQDINMSRGPGVGHLRCEWTPDLPRKLSRAELRQYRAGRDAHYQRVANIIGGTVACLG